MKKKIILSFSVSLHFQFKIIKVQSKINKFMSFLRMAVVGHHRCHRDTKNIPSNVRGQMQSSDKA